MLFNYNDYIKTNNLNIIVTAVFPTYFKFSPVGVYHNHSPQIYIQFSRISFSPGCGISHIS